MTSPALYAARPNWNADEPGDQRAVEVEERGAALLRAPQRRAARRGRQDVRALGQTRTTIASPWPPPEQIAAQP